MSLSAESLVLRRKHKATEQAETNGDPLVAKKKAQEASKHATFPSRVSTTSKLAPVVLR
jgi:hypothetical protein